MDGLKAVGKFELLEKIGHGGFSAVYRCRSRDNGEEYAIKIGHERVNTEYEDKKHDLDAMSHMDEWRAYKALGFGINDTPGIPSIYETGLAVLPSKELRPYLVLQLLGRALSNALKNTIFQTSRVFCLAHDALRIIQHIHEAGYIHRDIKPSNFCFGERKEEDEASLFVLDLGLAKEAPKQIDRRLATFVGTPDYSSIAALKLVRQSYRDDLESLGYTILELWLGDLPWYVANSKSIKGREWDRKTLRLMADRREKGWKESVKGRMIPSFIVTWIDRCKSMNMTEKPDYEYFHKLLMNAEDKIKRENDKNKRKINSRSSETEEEGNRAKRQCVAEE